jgi:vitamin B12 transporter
MTQNKTSAQSRATRTGRTLIGIAAITLCGHVPAEIENDLETLVVSAWRMPEGISGTTSAVTLLDPGEMESIGLLDIKDALDRIPGVISTSTGGQTGALGSVFIRGTTTSYSQLVVDGMRVSDSTTPFGNFLSGARVNDFSRIEVIRGPQAAIHGGESVGGVIWMETARGSGEPMTYLRTEIGSFDTINGYGSNSGSKDGFSWHLGGGYEHTDNDAPNESYDLIRSSMRLEWAQSEDLTIGMTYRGQDSRFRYDFFGGNVDYVDSNLVTAYADAQLAPGWISKSVIGFNTEAFDNDTAFGNYGSDLERIVLSTDQSVELSENHKLLFGGFIEHTDYSNTIGTVSDEYRYGGHLGIQWTPSDRFTADAVVRWEDYVNYSDQVTWRIGGGWQPLDKTRLRVGIGKAFRTPTLLDLYGTTFGLGNPNLEAEDSLGWDLGIEQELGEDHRVSVTYFENSIENQIEATFAFPLSPPPVNLPGSTRTRGVEFAAYGRISERIDYQLSWTWLGDSLQDQPNNTATASIQYRPSEKLLLGCGASYVDERSYGGGPLDSYLLLRIHGSYALTENVTVHARVENLADEGYELSRFGNSIKGAGLGVFTGLTATF